MRLVLRFFHILLNIERLLQDIKAILQQDVTHLAQQEVWLDSFEVMAQYKISRSTLYRWKRDAVLKPSSLGKKDMFLKSDIERVLRSS